MVGRFGFMATALGSAALSLPSVGHRDGGVCDESMFGDVRGLAWMWWVLLA